MGEDFPDINVESVGAARQRPDGAREQDYRDVRGDMWTCVTDGVSRSWHRQKHTTVLALRLVHVAGGG